MSPSNLSLVCSVLRSPARELVPQLLTALEVTTCVRTARGVAS